MPAACIRRIATTCGDLSLDALLRSSNDAGPDYEKGTISITGTVP
jgi:hypothetical protein